MEDFNLQLSAKPANVNPKNLFYVSVLLFTLFDSLKAEMSFLCKHFRWMILFDNHKPSQMNSNLIKN